MEYKGYTIEIEQDQFVNESPRGWDNMFTMFCRHNRYNLGDEGAEDPRDIMKGIVLYAPLYIYDHCGITMYRGQAIRPEGEVAGDAQSRIANVRRVASTPDKLCDVSMVGWIYITRERLLNEYGRKRLSRKLIDKAVRVMDGEIQTYDQYLTGDVWGYTISKDGEDQDSLWGLYGYEYAEDEAKRTVDYLATTIQETA